MILVSIPNADRFARLICCALVASSCLAADVSARAETLAVQAGAGGKLAYQRDEQGNRIPDFSNCGYAGADREIPDVPVRVTVTPVDGDDDQRIQAAIDYVAQLPLDERGFRGAVLLAPGQFQVAGQLRISTSEIVLRGSGATEAGTTLIATGQDRRALVRIEGIDDRRWRVATPLQVVDAYVPVGVAQLQLPSTADLRAGDTVVIARRSTIQWIKALGMDALGVGWKPGMRDILWDRVVTAVDGTGVTLDAPITTAIETRFGGAALRPYDWPGRIERVGVEDLRMLSSYSAGRPRDEDHAWFGITLQNAQNAWVRRVEFRHFAGGAVLLCENAKWVTIEDCVSLAPISETAGYRRHTFFIQGQLNLVLRCWSEQGRHDYAVGHCAAGPNAFVNCCAAQALGDSGPLESWACGVLYDNVRIDGAGLSLDNGWTTPPGTGWSAANCVLWQCQSATMRCFRPPTANNWAIGVWAESSGDATFQGRSEFVDPLSLYQAQLRERVGADAASRVDPILLNPSGATNPTIEKAAEFVARSDRPARQLIDVIRERMQQKAVATAQRAVANDSVATVSIDQVLSRAGGASSGTAARIPSTPSTKPLTVQNGWLVVDGRLKTGGRLDPVWWRGVTHPGQAAAFGPAITRFVPGRTGQGLTDDLDRVGDEMVHRGIAAYDHHYGLWYDRRRDDHLMVRRSDGDVAPPFYEQPFARGGVGTAWDGLSKYDLRTFNPWYWRRLQEFARICDQRDLVLFHQNYFQHNVLEAGAHWADCPWRPANNVNDTGLPEPPPYVGDKRIFLAHRFYDVSDARRRELHRGYIRQCLDNFAECSNVIQMTSAEYSGPLEFVQFWIDTIVEWQREHRRDVLIGLSCPKDVQDAILADPRRGPHVDVIDIRYWTYTANGQFYAPEGGKNLSTRQHLRQLNPPASSFASIVRAVRECRARYPEKAVLYNADLECRSGRDGWAVLLGGGSLPGVPALPLKLAQVIPTLRPAVDVVSGPGRWCLAREGHDYLVYSEAVVQPIEIVLPDERATYRVSWISPESGVAEPGGEINASQRLRLKVETKVLWLTRIDVE